MRHFDFLLGQIGWWDQQVGRSPFTYNKMETSVHSSVFSMSVMVKMWVVDQRNGEGVILIT